MFNWNEFQFPDMPTLTLAISPYTLSFPTQSLASMGVSACDFLV